MCLLDAVIGWDAERISCRTSTHRAVDNPLRAHGRLGIACGLEYAAQAMAAHGALVAGAASAALADPEPPPAAAPAGGFLAGVRALEFFALRLDDVQSDVTCNVVRVAGDGGTAVYEFELRSSSKMLLRGRATVVLDAGSRIHVHPP
jgi:predicted hotdog family 3-hydroxylacyl-ACP dehydratase